MDAIGCGNDAYMELKPEFNGRRADAVDEGGGELATWSDPLR